MEIQLADIEWINVAQNTDKRQTLLTMKANKMHYFSDLFDKVLYIVK